MPSRGGRGRKRSAICADSFVEQIRQEAEQSVDVETMVLEAYRTLASSSINLETIRSLPFKVATMQLSAIFEQRVMPCDAV